MEICSLGSSDEVPLTDHVIVVKLSHERFEVSGTAGSEETAATFLRPVLFSKQAEALKRAEQFAEAHSLEVVYTKGFIAAAPT